MEKEFKIKNSRGQNIAGKIYIPEVQQTAYSEKTAADNKYPTVIIAHGFGGNYRAFEYHGIRMCDKGIVVVLFDFCGGGMNILSDGDMTEMSVLTEAEDLEAVIEFTKKQEYVDTNNINLLGESQGGFVSAYVAAQNKSVNKLILWYPAFVIQNDIRKRIKEGKPNHALGMEIGDIYNKDGLSFDIYDKLQGFEREVLIIHGSQDGLVPLSYSERAVEIYKNSRLEVIEDAGHGFVGDDSKYARRLSVRFILGT